MVTPCLKREKEREGGKGGNGGREEGGREKGGREKGGGGQR